MKQNFDIGSQEERRVYERSAILMLVKAVSELYPGRKVLIRHSVRYDIYFEIEGQSELLPVEVAEIERRMRELSKECVPFRRVRVPMDEALKVLEEKGHHDLFDALRERSGPHVVFYDFGGLRDYSYGPLAPDSGCIRDFSLLYRYPGAMLNLPFGEARGAVGHMMHMDAPKLLNVFAEYKNWGRILGIENIGELNKAARGGGAPDIIRVAEALQEKKISQIADAITNSPERRKIVFVAGPSSSGKTTFANRLSIQLRVNGYLTTIISMDDYYKNNDEVPRCEDGTRDLESPDALDIKLFTGQMKTLIAGQQVNAPVYNFKRSRREDFTRPLSVGDRQILIVEGIHGLNPVISASIPKENKYKIYISALTSLSIDDHNRIPTTDARLIRRIVRDHKFRGTSAQETIRMWSSVRAGEEEHIFPYQESCDSMFNSGLIYELGAMKTDARALLAEIGRQEPEYPEAARLDKFLSYFTAVPPDGIPANSILREFLGGSCFG